MSYYIILYYVIIYPAFVFQAGYYLCPVSQKENTPYYWVPIRGFPSPCANKEQFFVFVLGIERWVGKCH
jgi:hypothetical protein